MSMRIVVTGADEVRQRLAGAPAQVTKGLRESMQKSLDIVYRRIADNLTGRVLNVRTGRLRQSIQTSVEDGGLRGRIGTNVNYAEIHEYGGRTIAHPIVARHKKALAFAHSKFIGPIRMTKKGKIARRGQTPGSVSVVRSVQHPGANVPARPYMRPALAESREEIMALLTAGMAEAIRGAK